MIHLMEQMGGFYLRGGQLMVFTWCYSDAVFQCLLTSLQKAYL